MVNVLTVSGFIILSSAFYAFWCAWFAVVARRWPYVVGKLLLAGVYEKSGIPPAYEPHVRYQYNVNGVGYEGTRLRFGGANPFSRTLASAEIPAYPASGEIRVYYDPRKPERACLVPGPNDGTFALPVLLFILGAGMFALGLYAGAS
jgi:hypothetical protein